MEYAAYTELYKELQVCLADTLDLTSSIVGELMHISLGDESVNKSLYYCESYIKSTLTLQDSLTNDVKITEPQAGIPNVQLDIKMVSRLFAILLQMRRNHDWLRNTLGNGELLTRQPGELVAECLAKFLYLLETIVEDCMHAYDDADCSHGSFRKEIGVCAPTNPEPMIKYMIDRVEKNDGQMLDFDM